MRDIACQALLKSYHEITDTVELRDIYAYSTHEEYSILLVNAYMSLNQCKSVPRQVKDTVALRDIYAQST